MAGNNHIASDGSSRSAGMRGEIAQGKFGAAEGAALTGKSDLVAEVASSSIRGRRSRESMLSPKGGSS